MKTAIQLTISFEQILAIVKQLPVKQKIELSKELEKETLDTKLSQLLSKFKTDDLDDETILEEVEKARQEIYAKKN